MVGMQKLMMRPARRRRPYGRGHARASARMLWSRTCSSYAMWTARVASTQTCSAQSH